jgi:hypothetical protein
VRPHLLAADDQRPGTTTLTATPSMSMAVTTASVCMLDSMSF